MSKPVFGTYCYELSSILSFSETNKKIFDERKKKKKMHIMKWIEYGLACSVFVGEGPIVSWVL